MRTAKFIKLLLNGFFLLFLILFLADQFSSMNIKKQEVKTTVYIGLLFLTPIALLLNLLVGKTLQRRLISSILPFIFSIVIGLVGPLRIVSACPAWKTQTILFQNGHFDSKRVEFQMQDLGAFGYNDRIVEVSYLTNWFMLVTPTKESEYERFPWIRTDKEVNELGLKYP